MVDNTQIKDGLGNEFTLRSKDLGGGVQGAMSIPMDSAGAPLFTPASPGAVGEVCVIAGSSFARPGDTTAYTSGDLVANSTTVVVPMVIPVARINGGSGRVSRGRLTKSGLVVTNAIFRAHFYKTLPTPANGDNGVFSTDQALGYVGSMTFDMTGANARVFTDGVKCISIPDVGSFIIFDAGVSQQTIYALIEARGAYVPASAENFTLALEVTQN